MLDEYGRCLKVCHEQERNKMWYSDPQEQPAASDMLGCTAHTSGATLQVQAQ